MAYSSTLIVPLLPAGALPPSLLADVDFFAPAPDFGVWALSLVSPVAPALPTPKDDMAAMTTAAATSRAGAGQRRRLRSSLGMMLLVMSAGGRLEAIVFRTNRLDALCP